MKPEKTSILALPILEDVKCLLQLLVFFGRSLLLDVSRPSIFILVRYRSFVIHVRHNDVGGYGRILDCFALG